MIWQDIHAGFCFDGRLSLKSEIATAGVKGVSAIACV